MFSTASNFPKFPFSTIYAILKPGYLPRCNTQCVYCTENANAFLSSPHPQLPFDINIGVVQRRYHCFRQLQIFPNFHIRPYLRNIKPCYLPRCNAQCVYCTEKANSFLVSAHPQLSFDRNIALVQSRYHCFRQHRIFPNFHSRPYMQYMKP